MSYLFFFSSYEQMAEKIINSSNFLKGDFLCSRFSNGELQITVKTSVIHQTCIILGSIAPPESNLFSFISLAHTLKKEGAKKCIALLPYLAYTRHEHKELGKSHLTALMGELLSSSGIDLIITIDIHSVTAKDLFPMQVMSLSPATRFAEELKQISYIPDTIIAPDEGALDRSKEMVKALGSSIPIIVMHKKREKTGVVHLEFTGDIGKKVLIIDDMIDTGETLVSAVRMLVALGVQEIIIMVSHGLFTGDLWKLLFTENVKKIYCTDTIPLLKEKTENYPIHILSVTSILQEFLCR